MLGTGWWFVVDRDALTPTLLIVVPLMKDSILILIECHTQITFVVEKFRCLRLYERKENE